MSSFTYGSFGDIITTAQLAWQLAQALSDSHGSSRRLKDLVNELTQLYSAIRKLTDFWQSRAQSLELEDLADIAKPAVTECRDAIETFLQNQIKRYGKSLLQAHGTRKSFIDKLKRIKWHTFETQRVEELREKLRRNKETLDIVHNLAQSLRPFLSNGCKLLFSVLIQAVNSAREEQNAALVQKRLADLATANTKSRMLVHEQLNEVMGALRDHTRNVVQIDQKLDITLSEFRAANTQVSSLVPRIYSTLSLYNQDTAFIEDSLGYRIPIYLATNPSWTTIRSIMQDQFRHRPGTNLVSGNKYVLQDASTGRDLQPDVEFHKMVRAGQTLSMTMIFPGNWSQSGNLEGNLENDRDNVCPKCLHPQAVNNTDMDITCGNAQCGFIYRRIQDFSNTSDDQLDVWLKQNDTHAIQDEEPLPLVTDSLSEDAQNIVAERYDLNGPEVFKRVRFITRWEDLEESRKGFSCTVGGIGFWRASHEGWCGMAYLQVLVLVMVQIREMKLIASRENTLHTKMKMCLYFAGCDKRNSIPVLVVFAESAVQRKRVRKVLGRLSAFTDSRLRLLVVDPVEFLADKARWERIKLRKTTLLSHEAKRVVQGITNRRNAG